MNDFEADLHRLGPDAVRVLLETGHYRRQTEQAQHDARVHLRRIKQAQRQLRRVRKGWPR
jgi:hypothetical protein